MKRSATILMPSCHAVRRLAVVSADPVTGKTIGFVNAGPGRLLRPVRETLVADSEVVRHESRASQLEL